MGVKIDIIGLIVGILGGIEGAGSGPIIIYPGALQVEASFVADLVASGLVRFGGFESGDI